MNNTPTNILDMLTNAFMIYLRLNES